MVRILVVDDDPKLRSYVCAGLGESGLESEQAEDGLAAFELISAHPRSYYDLLLLDVMMPREDGWALLQRLRERGDDTPVIFLTARDAVDERVKGLSLGADDYIIKPFEFAELLARVDAVLRRHSTKPALRFGPVSLDLVARSVLVANKKYELPSKEFELLAELVRAGGSVVTRTELLSRVWKINFDPETNLVDVYIARLRRRLMPLGPELIRTQRGEGYFLVEPELEEPQHD
jgi:two-component system copper resistance phosphate regulon response regulator CusR